MIAVMMAAVARWLSFGHQLRENIDGYWEDDGTVLLCRNIVEGLQVTQLHSPEK